MLQLVGREVENCTSLKDHRFGGTMYANNDWIATIPSIFDCGVEFQATLMLSFSGGIRHSTSLKVCQFHV